jgi:hypothetical protein
MVQNIPPTQPGPSVLDGHWGPSSQEGIDLRPRVAKSRLLPDEDEILSGRPIVTDKDRRQMGTPWLATLLARASRDEDGDFSPVVRRKLNHRSLKHLVSFGGPLLLAPTFRAACIRSLPFNHSDEWESGT